MNQDGAASGALFQRVAGPFFPADLQDADTRVAEWLAGLDGHADRDLVRRLADMLAPRSPARDMLGLVFVSSPHLTDLFRFRPERLCDALSSNPEIRLGQLLADLGRDIDATDDEASAMAVLRRTKAEASLLVALCDIGAIWAVSEVTAALTRLADVTVASAARFLLAREAARGRYLPVDAANPDVGSGLIVLAMGKMGAGELNYSSDIDLIVFYDRAKPRLAEGVEPQSFFVRLAQGLARLLQQATAEGYVFRVDLRLRPDPASTPAAISAEAALSYYETEGRTWERAAMIKARACAGDRPAGEALLRELAPFVWRKHLDFTAIADVHDMKRQMHAYKGHSEIAVEGHNVKLGRGGIREIEFFVQTQQLIAGGRHPELRQRATLVMLDELTAFDWISPQARDDLREAYLFLRMVEHRLQMVADEQTHELPSDRDGVDRLARFAGFEGREPFAQRLVQHLSRVQTHYSRLFEPQENADPTGRVPDFTLAPTDARLLDCLLEMGFKEPLKVAETVAEWLGGEYRALRPDGALRPFRDLLPVLFQRIAATEHPDATVLQFDRFLLALQSGARLFSLLQQNHDLISLIVLILGTAPRLGDMLARDPRLMDGLIDPGFFGEMPSDRNVARRLSEMLTGAHSYEDFLDRIRLFGQENLFLIGTRILSGTVSARHAGEAFANTADGIVRVVHRRAEDMFAETYGRVGGQKTAILAMGRLGGREMTATSDLDLIVIYDFDPDRPDSDGRRALQGPEYFARLTHRLISAFTTPTNYGVLYNIDMRLRPSGRAGPVATRIDAFAEYQANEAWTWEHMALTRARVVSAEPEFKTRIEAVIAEVLRRPRDPAAIRGDALDMRRAIAAEKGEGDIWDLKNAAGGLLDIEFIAQVLQLLHAHAHPEILDTNFMTVLDRATQIGLLPAVSAAVLRPAARLYSDLLQISRLCVEGTFRPDSSSALLHKLLIKAADEPDLSALEARLRDTQADVRNIFSAILGADVSAPE